MFPGCERVPLTFLLSGGSRFDFWRGHGRESAATSDRGYAHQEDRCGYGAPPPRPTGSVRGFRALELEALELPVAGAIGALGNGKDMAGADAMAQAVGDRG